MHLSSSEVAESLRLLESDGWEIDPLVRDLTLGRLRATDERVSVRGVVFHIPRLERDGRYVLWRCHWPDCTNCCKRQGRLPLTSDDLVTIGAGMKYRKVSDFVRAETLTSTWAAPGPSDDSVMTTINLKRSESEEAGDDGTRIACRFLDGGGACTLHPGRPGVCRLYPFSTWLENERGTARVHAAFQFTGDCPGFYLAGSPEDMREVLDEYAGVISSYNAASMRTSRTAFGASSV